MGTGCGTFEPHKAEWCSRQILHTPGAGARVSQGPLDRSRFRSSKIGTPCLSKSHYPGSSAQSGLSNLRSYRSRNKLIEGTSRGFGLSDRALPLDTSLSAMRGLALLRALNAAVAFEGHVIGRGNYATWIVAQNRAFLDRVDPRHNQEVIRSRQAVCNGTSSNDNPSMDKAQGRKRDFKDGSSPRIDTVFLADSSNAPSNGSSTKRPLPPLAIVEQLLNLSGGSSTLPLFKNTWTEANRGRHVWRDSTSGHPADRSHTAQSLLAGEGIMLATSTSGTHSAVCPKCNGGVSSDTSLSVTIDSESALWQCSQAECGWSGRVNLPHQSSTSSHGGSEQPPNSHPQAGKSPLPPPRAPKLPRPEELLDLSPEMLDFFRQRGVSEQTLARNGIRMQLAYSPQTKETGAAIMFPYVRDGRLVNAKYRTLEKQYWQVKGAEQSLFGIDDVSGSETVIILEGEMDKLAMEEAGYTNCVSVPGGAPTDVKDQVLPPPNPNDDRQFAYLWTCQEQLSKATKFVLATDGDRPGLVLSEELVRRLGRERCWQATWPNMPDGQRVKDANEALLMLGKEGVRAAIEGARAFPSLEAVETELELSAECSKQTENEARASGAESVAPNGVLGDGLSGETQGGFAGSAGERVGAVITAGAGSSVGGRDLRESRGEGSRQTGSVVRKGQTQSVSLGVSKSRSGDGLGTGVSSLTAERASQDGLFKETGQKHARSKTQGAEVETPEAGGDEAGADASSGSRSGSAANGLLMSRKFSQGLPLSATADGVALRGVWGARGLGVRGRRLMLSGDCNQVSVQTARGMSNDSWKAVNGGQSQAAWEGNCEMFGGCRLCNPLVAGRVSNGGVPTEEVNFSDTFASRSRQGQVVCRGRKSSGGEVEAGDGARKATGSSRAPIVRKVGLRRSKVAPNRDGSGTGKGLGGEPTLLTDILPRQGREGAQPSNHLGVAKSVSESEGAQVRGWNGKMGALASAPSMHAATGTRHAATAAPAMTDLIRKITELSVREKRADSRTPSKIHADRSPSRSESIQTSETGLGAAYDPRETTVSNYSSGESELERVTPFGRREVTVAEYSPLPTTDALSPEVESDGPTSPAAAGLNDEQLAAVFAPVGPVRVVAGPGSGKTKVLTNRVAHLVLDRGIRPWNILCITFTNKAASEMRERVRKMLDDVKDNGPALGTFHGICARILRKSVTSIPDCGRTSTYVIYDESDSINLLRPIVKSIPGMDVKSVKFRDLLTKLVNEKLWRLKLEIKTQLGAPLGGQIVPLANSLTDSGEEPPIQMDPTLQLIAAQYEAELRKCNAFDFSDLLIWSVRLLRSCPSDLQDYRKLWRHFLVDEFQDTDFAQYELVRLLGKEHQSVFVVGDLDQSIYGWRGADFHNMQTLFERDFPGGHVYQLRKNYRSTITILQAAEALITRSEVSRMIGKHEPLQLEPIKPRGRNITFLESETDKKEAARVVVHVRHMVDAQGHSWGDMALLYRTNMQSRLFQEQLTKQGIPFLVLGGLSFYARKEIKDIISYLKLIANPLDEVALNRVLNVPPRGIGPKAFEKLHLWAASLKMSLPKALYEHRKGLPEALVLVGKAKTEIRKFLLLLDHLAAMSHTASLDELIREILQRTEYQKYIAETKSESDEEKMERWQHILDLRHAAQDHASKNGVGATALAAFLEDVALVAAVDEEGIEGGAGKSAQAAKPVVKLMTIHASKGLEFPCVFLVGLEEGLLPTSQAFGVPSLVAEERRLCYVAITRAKDRLFLSRAETRFRNGEVLFQKPSRFWGEMS